MTTPTAQELDAEALNGANGDCCDARIDLAQRLADALAEAKSWEEQTEMMRELVLQQSTCAETAEACCEATHDLIVTKGDVLARENIELRAQLARLVEATRAVYRVAQRSTVEFEHLRAVLDEIEGKP